MMIMPGDYMDFISDGNKVTQSAPPKIVAEIMLYNKHSNFSYGEDLFDLSLVPAETMEAATKIFDEEYKDEANDDDEDGEQSE